MEKEGGAERFYDGLVDSLSKLGVAAERVDVVSDESSFEAIEESYLRFYDLDLSRFDGVISTKSPGYLVRHPNHVCYLQHTMRAFYDMFDVEFANPDARLLRQRRQILRLDTLALKPPRTRSIYVIGKEVQARLLRYNQLSSDVLYQASTMSGFRCGVAQYVFLPGRLHRWKRVGLVISAMNYMKHPIELKIAGTGEDEAYFRHLAEGNRRIRFLGRVEDRQLVELYADALVVPFVPLREDFGLVTLEAFLSKKPVITCLDSGEPANIVRHGRSGFVCSPSPREIASRLDYLYENPEVARAMGKEGFESIQHITWENVGLKLLKALSL